MSDVWPCPKCRGTLSQSCGLCDGKGRVVICSSAEHEALMAAAKALHDLIVGNKKGCISRGHDALAALRAAGVMEEKT